MDALFEKPRLRSLVDHFALIPDPRASWRVAHPLPEVLLVVCGSIAGCDDFDDIVEWGKMHLAFRRRFLPFYHGIPGARWVNLLINRIPPELFSACFLAWASEVRPDAPDFIALDGKTSRRSHDRSAGRQALHLVSAFATTERLVLGQEAGAEKSCEQAAIPNLLDKLAAAGGLKGAIVTIDAIASRRLRARSSITAPTMCWRSRTTNRHSRPRSQPSSHSPNSPRSRSTATSTRDTAASRSACALCRTRSIGSQAPSPILASRAFPSSPRPPGARLALNLRTAATSRRAITSPRHPSAPNAWPMQGAAIGASRTRCIGCSTWCSRTTCRGCARATAPRTWRWCAISPSTWSEPPRTNGASNCAESLPAGTKTTSPHDFSPLRVNPDSLPCDEASLAHARLPDCC